MSNTKESSNYLKKKYYFRCPYCPILCFIFYVFAVICIGMTANLSAKNDYYPFFNKQFWHYFLRLIV